MKYICAILVLCFMTVDSTACSDIPSNIDLGLKKKWAKADKQKLLNQRKHNIPVPRVEIINYKRGVEAPGLSCGDSGVLRIKISLPGNSKFHIKDYAVYFNVAKGYLPANVLSEFPVSGYRQGSTKIFNLVWLDGHPMHQKDIVADLEISLVAQSLDIGVATTLKVRVPKSSFSNDYYWSWLSIPALLHIVKNKKEEAYIRIAAAKRLGQFRLIYFLRMISDIVSDKSEPQQLRKEIIDIWAGLNNPVGLKFLMEHAGTDDAGLLSMIIEALREYKDERAYAVILKGLQAKNSYVRLASVRAIAFHQNNKLKQHIRHLLNDHNQEVRLTAAMILGYSKNKKAFSILLNSKDDIGDHMQLGVMTALIPYKDRRAVPYFIDILKTKNGLFRELALSALKEIDAPEAQNAIKEFEASLTR